MELRKQWFAIGFAAICGLVMILSWFLLLFEMNGIGNSSLLRIFFNLFCDSLLIIIPYWLLPARFRGALLLPVWINSIWLISSVWYFRFWSDIPGLDSLTTLGNINGLLLKSIPGVWNNLDLINIILPLLTTIFYFLFRHKISQNPFPNSFKTTVFLISIVLFISGQVSRTVSNKHYLQSVDAYNNESLWDLTSDRIKSFTVNSRYFNYNGPLLFFCRSAGNLYTLLNKDIKLDEEDILGIERYLASLPSLRINGENEENSDKNVILIVVESLNSEEIFHTVDGRDIAPTLKGLVQDSLSFSALNIVSQIRNGGSGDGQLIINTGLLPTSIFSTSTVYGSHTLFPSLPKSLGRKSNCAIFGDDGKVWNEIETFKRFGFEKVFTNSDYSSLAAKNGADGGLFVMADSIITDLPQPFFLELLTVSMHVPFSIDDVPYASDYDWIDSDKTSSAVKKKYLKTLSYFDDCLKEFIANLKAKNLWYNTILLIVSDHSQDIAEANKKLSLTDVPMAFIAINSGKTGYFDYTAGQIDIFPTILSLTGSRNSSQWRGLGTSMTETPVKAAYVPAVGILGEVPDATTEKRLIDAYEISELIIRGNYFSVVPVSQH